MSHSFFTGTDAELYTGSMLFAAKISAEPEVFGLSSEMAEAYVVLDAVYAEAYATAIAPSTRTKGAVAAKREARVRLERLASQLAKIIKGTTTVTSEQRIALGINVPRQRAPMPAPGSPSRFAVELRGDGSLRLRWTCDNPRGSTGTLYHVSRRTTTGGEFAFVGASGKKWFVDERVPAGAAAVTYRVQAVRSTRTGTPAEFNVNIGSVVVGAPAGTSAAKAA
jgi:hypothetical protein